MPRSSRKPRIAPEWASDFAQTTKTSAIGALVIQVFDAGEPVAAGNLDGAGLHAAGVGAVVGLGQAEAADDLAGGEPRQVFPPLLLGAVGVDREHHQRGLDAEGGAVAQIDPLDLARDQAIGDVAGAGAAILLGDGRAEQAEGAHLGHDLAVEAVLAERGQHPRLEPRLGVVARGVADEPLLLGQLVFEQQRVRPVEGRLSRPRLHRLNHRHARRPSSWCPFARIITQPAARDRGRPHPDAAGRYTWNYSKEYTEACATTLP